MRKLFAVFAFAVPVVATASPPAEADAHTICRSVGPNVEKCRIDEPDVKQVCASYPAIVLRPCDKVTFTAGGCAQTGGSGKTWKRYVDPIGGNGKYYYGTVMIPGVVPGDCSRDLEGHGLVSIGDVIKHGPYVIPHDVGTGVGTVGHPNGPRSLTLGYTDNVYRDNGYWGRSGDDGTEGQCHGLSNAFVEVTIERATSCPTQQSDGVKDGDETDVDCGGTSAPACVDGKTCAADRDCKTGKCALGKCLAPPSCDWCQYDVSVTTCAARDHSGNGGCAGIKPGVSINGVKAKNGAQVELVGISNNPTDRNGHTTLTVRTCKSQYMSFDVDISGFSLWGSPNPAPPACSNIGQTFAPIDAPSAPPRGTGGDTAVHHPPPPPPPPHGKGDRR